MKYSIEYCNLRWAEATALCEENLSEEERLLLKRIKTYEDFKGNVSSLQSTIKQVEGSRLIQKFLSLLDPFIGFITLLAAYISSSSAETAITWGLMSILLRV